MTDHNINCPRAYDVSQPADVSRLLHETIGYMRVSVKHGTDTEGRRFALKGLEDYLAAWLVRATEDK